MPVHRKYQLPSIDMTPFVSISLLLLVFFAWVKMMQKPNMFSLELPDDGNCYWGAPFADASLFLIDSNRIGLLIYKPANSSAKFIETDYSAQGLEKQLKRLIQGRQRLIVVVSPTRNTIFKNVVDVLDEFRRLKHIHFRFSYGLTPDEREMLAKYNAYKRVVPDKPVSIRWLHYPGRVIIDRNDQPALFFSRPPLKL